MIHEKIIKDYLKGHPVIRKFKKDETALLKRILLIFLYYKSDDIIDRLGSLLQYCNLLFTDYRYPEANIGRVAVKVFDLLIQDHTEK